MGNNIQCQSTTSGELEAHAAPQPLRLSPCVRRPAPIARIALSRPGASAGKRLAEARGQSTVEFMLMVPVLFSLMFFIIEMSLYFSSIHFANYGAFVAARANQTGFGNGSAGDAFNLQSLSELVLTGSIFKNNYAMDYSNEGGSNSGVHLQMEHWQAHWPFLNTMLPDMRFEIQINMGPDESIYEDRGRPPCTDNDMTSNPC